MIRLAYVVFTAVFLASHAAWAAQPPVEFKGDMITIVHDGSQTAYNPHTEAGRLAMRAARETCCVEAPPHFAGEAEPFTFNADPDRHLLHEGKRFVVNRRTGAFISSTTLEDTKYPVTDPRRYVDSDLTPMVALSTAEIARCGCKPGDRALVTDAASGAHVWAVYGNNAGDQEQELAYTAISAATAAALHIVLDAVTKQARQIGYHLTIAVYPGSGFGDRFPHGGGVPPVVTR